MKVPKTPRQEDTENTENPVGREIRTLLEKNHCGQSVYRNEIHVLPRLLVACFIAGVLPADSRLNRYAGIVQRRC